MNNSVTRRIFKALGIITVILVIGIIYDLAEEGFYYDAYASQIPVGSQPRLPIAKPSVYTLLSDKSGGPGDSAYLRELTLNHSGATFNSVDLKVYFDDPIDGDPIEAAVCLILTGSPYCIIAAINVGLYDNQGILLSSHTGIYVVVFSSNPTGGYLLNLTNLGLSQPASISSVGKATASIDCIVGC